MSTRIQVVLDKNEKQAFKAVAKREGLSLSAWLKLCALERLKQSSLTSIPNSLEQLKLFFEKCDEREKGEEPDWSEHKEVIARSITTGISET